MMDHRADPPLKFRIPENPRWRRPPFRKPQKMRCLRNGLTDLYEIWYVYANESLNRHSIKTFEFQKSKMADGRYFENRKFAISVQPFDRF